MGSTIPCLVPEPRGAPQGSEIWLWFRFSRLFSGCKILELSVSQPESVHLCDSSTTVSLVVRSSVGFQDVGSLLQFYILRRLLVDLGQLQNLLCRVLSVALEQSACLWSMLCRFCAPLSVSGIFGVVLNNAVLLLGFITISVEFSSQFQSLPVCKFPQDQ